MDISFQIRTPHNNIEIHRPYFWGWAIEDSPRDEILRGLDQLERLIEEVRIGYQSEGK